MEMDSFLVDVKNMCLLDDLRGEMGVMDDRSIFNERLMNGH